MKKFNLWISISDLLSSVVLVLLLLFVCAAVFPKYSQLAKQQLFFRQLDFALKDFQDKGLVKINFNSALLEFTSVTFSSGSAVLNPQTSLIIKTLADNLKSFLDSNQSVDILIEGHTDPAAVNAVQNEGGYFSDNIQLSTLRAANVRLSLLDFMGKQYSKRIGVAGYGETRLKNTDNPFAPENRRIELRILWNSSRRSAD